MQPGITTTITCVKCGGNITGAGRDYIIRCPYCGAGYQVSVSAVMVTPASVEERINLLAGRVTLGNPGERHDACLELAKIRDWRVVPAAVEAYRKLFNDVDNYAANLEVMEALGDIIARMDDPGAAGVLAEALKDDSAVIRMQAARALGNIAHPATVNALISAASAAGDEARSAYMDALSAFSDERIPPLLVSGLNDKRYYVKCAALRSLGKLRYAGAIDVIISMLGDRSRRGDDGPVPWGEVRMWAANALGDIGDESAVNPLMDALEDEDADVSRYAANALRAIWMSTGDESLRERIDRALKDRIN